MCITGNDMYSESRWTESGETEKISAPKQGLTMKQVEAAKHGPLLTFHEPKIEARYSHWATRASVESFEEQPLNVFNFAVVFMLTFHAANLAEEECNKICEFCLFVLLPLMALIPMFFQNVMDRSNYVQLRETIVCATRVGFVVCASAVRHPVFELATSWDKKTLMGGVAWSFLSSAAFRTRVPQHLAIQAATILARLAFGYQSLQEASPMSAYALVAWYLITDVAATTTMVYILESFNRLAFLKELYGDYALDEDNAPAPTEKATTPRAAELPPIEDELLTMLNAALVDKMQMRARKSSEVPRKVMDCDDFDAFFSSGACKEPAPAIEAAVHARRMARNDSMSVPTLEAARAAAYTLVSF